MGGLEVAGCGGCIQFLGVGGSSFPGPWQNGKSRSRSRSVEEDALGGTAPTNYSAQQPPPPSPLGSTKVVPGVVGTYLDTVEVCSDWVPRYSRQQQQLSSPTTQTFLSPFTTRSYAWHGFYRGRQRKVRPVWVGSLVWALGCWPWLGKRPRLRVLRNPGHTGSPNQDHWAG